jgi:hypothetical protein
MRLLNQLWRIFRTHPLSIFFYFLYLILAWTDLSLEIRVKNMVKHDLAVFEGLMYGIFFLILIAALFLLITIINLIVRVERRKFYRSLLLFIALPLAVIILIGYY